jgi:predicted flap endonuclease-1-like 5' DNA nuclease
MNNETIAERLLAYARELEREGPNVFRVRAYRSAAETVRGLERPVEELFKEQGRDGLESLPGIGRSLAFTLEGLIEQDSFRTLRPADAHIEPDRLLTSLPGVGPELARRLHETLGITTLPELEQAARAGRLAEVGIGHKRLRGLLDALAGRLAQSAVPEPVPNEPEVHELLEVDEAYRRHADHEDLPTLRPRRYNPEGERWLPIFRSERGPWQIRVLFSNTALAHRLGKTRDWVVLYFTDGKTSGQRTVVTETRGDLLGRRVVRGRERECRALAQAGKEPAA